MKCQFGDAYCSAKHPVWLLSLPLFRNELYLQLGRNMAILPLVSWCLLSQELTKKNPKEIRKKKHGCMELPWGQHES